MNSFQTSSYCECQVRFKLHQQNVSDGLARCADLAQQWTPLHRSIHDASFLLMSLLRKRQITRLQGVF